MTTREWFRVMRAHDWETDPERLLMMRRVAEVVNTLACEDFMVIDGRLRQSVVTYTWWRNWEAHKVECEAVWVLLKEHMAAMLQG